MPQFTLRVYGLLVHDGHVLVADELIRGQRITKFPGGGLEYGEGLKECLVREIREELGVDAFDLEHVYTTDFFQQSVFNSTPMQVVSVYYTFRTPDPAGLRVVTEPFAGIGEGADQEVFRWLALDNARIEDVSLPIDRVVLGQLLATVHRGEARNV
ncbi:MAG TPA: NUDIX domain-containing protein [Flavobacteriales bacterium]|nr:NUDIX domain-containing protein [Flavobacteriales bacterium]HMR27968.1 NUDIX domain-containing protein [Flavobacteriales bacterium]